MKIRLLILIRKLVFLILIICMPLMMVTIMGTLTNNPDFTVDSLFRSFFIDGTFIVIALVLNSIGLYNLFFSKRRLIISNVLLMTTTMMGMLLLMMNSLIFVALKYKYMLSTDLDRFMTMQIVTIIVSLIWFATIEFLIDLNQDIHE